MSFPVIALHGNPGYPEDWNRVKALLPKDIEFVTLNMRTNDWVAEVRRHSGKVILAGFSWSCYEIARHFEKVRDKVERVVFVAPYFHPQKPLSGVATALIQAPVVGDLLIKKSHAKSIRDFATHMMAPAHDESAVRDFLSRAENDWMAWKFAAINKITQQNHPLPLKERHDLKGTIVYGAQDQSSPWNEQRAHARKMPLLKVIEIPEGGHGLLWTHAPKIAEVIAKTANPAPNIGYHKGSSPDNNVTRYMDRHLREHPERIALRWVAPADLKAWSGKHGDPLPHQQINFAQFSARINACAAGLQSIGITKGDRVIIFLPMSLDMYTAMFAVQKIGAIAVFLDSWARSHHLGASAECVSPKAMVSFKQAFDLVNQVPEFSSMPLRVMYGPGEGGTHRFEDLIKPPQNEPAAVESEATALITFTTGSTGKPKGANRTHRFLSAQHLALDHVIPYEDGDIDMPAFPIFSLNNLAGGVTTVLPAVDLAAPGPRDAAAMASQILHEKITCTTLSPSMLVNLAKYCAENKIILSGLRRVVTGGAPISKDDVQSFYKIAPQTDIWILYGSTEAEPMAHIEGREMLALEAPADDEVIENGVNVGHISEDIDYKFIKLQRGPIELQNDNWKDCEVARGQVGEFIVTGDHVCREYYNNPEAFKTTKIIDGQNRVWHRTGDLAYLDDKNCVWIVGRVNNAIQRAGTYYFPVQAEILLKRFPFVHRCAFLGMPDAHLGEKNTVVIELGPSGAHLDREKAQAQIRAVFGKNKIPVDAVHFVDKVPMDPRHHSKVEYGVLRQQLLDGGLA